MGIARFDDGLTAGPKFIAAGAAACWLWFCGVLYCRRGLTDGFIPRAAVPTLVGGLTRPFVHAATLVKVGLWQDEAGGYRVHDYGHWNPSKAEVNEYRDRERRRKAGEASARNGRAEGVRGGALRAAASSAPLRSAPLEDPGCSEGGSAGGTVAIAPVWAAPGRGRAGLAVSHARCYPASAACGRGVCVPAALGAEWARQYADPAEAERAIEAFVVATVAALGAGPVGDEPYRFWRAAWTHRHGRRAPAASGSRTGDTLEAAAGYLRDTLRRDGDA